MVASNADKDGVSAQRPSLTVVVYINSWPRGGNGIRA